MMPEMGIMIVSIDGGATKTCSAVYDETAGNVISVGVSGPSNFAAVSPETAKENIKLALDRSLENASLKLKDVDSVIFGIAGVGDSREDTETGHRIVREILGNREFEMFNDGYFAYRAANMFSDGVVFASGTGSVGFFQNGDRMQRIGGWGWFAGDEGSASWVSKKAINFAQRQHDGIIPGRSFVNMVEEYFSDELRECVGKLERKHEKRRVALLCPSVASLAKEGDDLAVQIFEESADYISQALKAMLSDFQGDVSVSVIGGLVLSGEFFRNLVSRRMKRRVNFFYGYQVCVGGIVAESNRKGFKMTKGIRDRCMNTVDSMIRSIPEKERIESLGY